jgi:hypothetical protein
MNRAYSLLSFALLLSVAGCGQSASTEGTTSRTITAVTWDANRQPVIDVRRVVVSPDSVNVDPGCGSNDLKLSDEPLVTFPIDLSSAPKLMHSTSNMLCLADPGDTEAVSLERFAYPVGVAQTWAHHVVSFMSASERGGFFNDGQEPGIAAFDFPFGVGEYENLPTQYQTANGVEFDVAVSAVCTPGASQCSGTALQHCDGWGQWQTSVDCASEGSGWQCNPATHSCDCPLPSASKCSSNSCGSITVSNACGHTAVDCGGCQGFAQTCVRNQCKVTSCHCAKGFTCDPDGACIRF